MPYPSLWQSTAILLHRVLRLGLAVAWNICLPLFEALRLEFLVLDTDSKISKIQRNAADVVLTYLYGRYAGTRNYLASWLQEGSFCCGPGKHLSTARRGFHPKGPVQRIDDDSYTGNDKLSRRQNLCAVRK